ncbi:hypothetical protein DLP05_079 [Stenotrophomonas phage vB_SmaS_DLP_5]|uniref:Uncharacterized protein n=1 Tax=Stenotrophomonas phage vB_SmaS_DLP_5 TaxID=2044561 RepID=A0A2D2W2C0_9CAUD|nr:hypothetical protein FDJ07_gp142 [Stenotrophomonas phage vB_SmaS_DLP_5]ATS92288.1 hypothetical protein DLP05_079 [Stenotrophomonas phage vB_SmaS_DLP_5]
MSKGKYGFGYGVKSLQDAIKSSNGKALQLEQAKQMVADAKKNMFLDFEVIETKHMPPSMAAVVPKGILHSHGKTATGSFQTKNYPIQSAMVDASLSLQAMAEKFKAAGAGITQMGDMMIIDSIPTEIQQMLGQQKLTMADLLGGSANSVQSIAPPSIKEYMAGGANYVESPCPDFAYVAKPTGADVLRRLKELGFEGSDLFQPKDAEALPPNSKKIGDSQVHTPIDVLESMMEEAGPMYADLQFAVGALTAVTGMFRQMRNEITHLRNMVLKPVADGCEFDKTAFEEQADIVLNRYETRIKQMEDLDTFVKVYDRNAAPGRIKGAWRKKAWQKVTKKDGQIIKTTLCQTEPKQKWVKGEYQYDVPEGTEVRQVWIVRTPQLLGL